MPTSEERLARMEATDVDTRMEGFDGRLRGVEVALGRVDQRLLVIERVVLPTPEPPAE